MPVLRWCNINRWNWKNFWRKILHFLEPEIQKKGVTVTKSFSPSAQTLSADPDLLYRAFLNILLNALQAMPEGGTLSLAVRHHPQEVEVEISDTGSGLSPEALEKAFDPFFTTKEKGSGLGLAIVKNTIEAHQGGLFWKMEPREAWRSVSSCPGRPLPEPL